jgi:hypothetical protein
MAKRIMVNPGPRIARRRRAARDLPALRDRVFLVPREVRQDLEAGGRAGPPPVRSDGATASRATTARSRTRRRVARGDGRAGAP